MAKTKETDAAKAAVLAVKAVQRPPPTPIEIFHRNITLVDKFSETRDAQQLARVWRYMGHLRVHLAASHLKAAIETYVQGDKARLLALLAVVTAARTPSGEVRFFGRGPWVLQGRRACSSAYAFPVSLLVLLLLPFSPPSPGSLAPTSLLGHG
jgi:hypothetical protein